MDNMILGLKALRELTELTALFLSYLCTFFPSYRLLSEWNILSRFTFGSVWGYMEARGDL